MAWRNLATMVGHWTMRGYGLWAAEERASGTLAGRIGFWNPEGWPGFELGWTLRRAFWGKGYATEGARAALRFAFTQLKQPHVISLIHPENAASIRVAERLGERRVDSTEVLGKPALSDLKEGKMTLPLILAMPRATPRERELVSRVVTHKSFDGVDPAEILAIATRYQTIDETREIARDYATRAKLALEPFPESPAREALEVALDFVMEREK